jgi:hypothetical protein
MPERSTVQKAKQRLRRGRAPSTAAGECVREEMHHVRGGKHGARSTKQAIAIGLSKARRAGVPLKPPKRVPARTRKAAQQAYDVGQHERRPRASSRVRGRATARALRHEPRGAASHKALARRHTRRRGVALLRVRRRHARLRAYEGPGWTAQRCSQGCRDPRSPHLARVCAGAAVLRFDDLEARADRRAWLRLVLDEGPRRRPG